MAAADRRPGRGGERRRARARRRRRATYHADLRDGPAQPREQRRDPGVRRPGRALGRRHVHERPADDPAGGPHAETGPRHPVAALLVHRAGTRTSLLADEGGPLGVRLRRPELRRLLRLRPRLDPVRQRSLHQGAEEHRHREERPTVGAEGGRRRLPVAAHERQLAAGPPHHGSRSASTVPSGCSSTGASSTTSSTSSASRTSRTTSVPAWGTSSTSSTRAAGDGTASLDTPCRSTNGRVWKMVLDPDDPTKVTSLSHRGRG